MTTESETPGGRDGQVNSGRLGLKSAPAELAMEPFVARNRSLTQQVRDFLRRAIFDETLKSDTDYSVSELSDWLQVSRTPVREAVLQLEEAGLLETRRNKGFRIKAVTASNLASAFQVRFALEPLAAGLVAASGGVSELIESAFLELQSITESPPNDEKLSRFMTADRIFHEAILERAGNPFVTSCVKEARDVTYRRRLTTESPERTWQQILEEHVCIYDALKAGDSLKAVQAMREHIRTTGEEAFAQHGMSVDPLWTAHY